jgi:ArsR family metal-binding transcriptional regulator
VNAYFSYFQVINTIKVLISVAYNRQKDNKDTLLFINVMDKNMTVTCNYNFKIRIKIFKKYDSQISIHKTGKSGFIDECVNH